MIEVWISEDLVFKAIERDNGYRGRQHITGWWNAGDDDIAFDNNRKEWGAEHYTLLDFVAAVGKQIPVVREAKCNQFGSEVKKGIRCFFFYRDEGATAIWE